MNHRAAAIATLFTLVGGMAITALVFFMAFWPLATSLVLLMAFCWTRVYRDIKRSDAAEDTGK